MGNAFEEHKARLKAAKEALKTAGPIHAKDLRRQIRRMENDLRIYIRYQKEAQRRT